jgi:hypothetical protein
MSRVGYPGDRPDRRAAQRERDAALDRVSRVRGVTIFGAGALAAALAAVVSAVAPGRSLGAKVPVRSHAVLAKRTPVRTASARMPPLASPSQLGLQGPAGAPQSAPPAQPSSPAPAPAQAAPAPAPPVSGGS